MAAKNTIRTRIVFEGGEEIRQGLKNLGDVGQAAFAALQRQTNDATRASTDFNKKLLDLRAGMTNVADKAKVLGDRISGTTRSIISFGSALVGAFSVRALVDMTAVWTDLNSQVRLVIDSGEDVGDVMSRLSEIANRTYSDLQLTAEGFVRNARVLKELGYTTKEQLNFQESLNNALVVSNAKGQRAQQVTDSIAKAMATGTLRGEELNNVLAFGGRIAELLAKHFNTTQGGLRKLSAEGKITGDVLYNVLVKNMELLRKEAESMPATISDGFLLIRNALLQFIGTADEASGVSQAIAQALAFIAQNIGAVVIAIGALIAAMLLVKGVALAKDLVALGVALVQLVPKIWAVTAALLANPLALIPTLIAAAIAAFVYFMATNEDFRNSVLAVGAAVLKFFSDMIAGAQAVGADIASVFTAITTTISDWVVAGEQLVTDFMDTVSGIVEDLVDSVSSLFSNLVDSIVGWFEGALDIINKVIEAAKEAISAIGKALGLGGGDEGSDSGGGGFAGGGHVRGPGTGTSDSILARLSDGEFVVKAKAVRKYGLGFLRALNGMRLRGTAFANGGLASAVRSTFSGGLPSFANGGEVMATATGPGGRPFTLVIDGSTFSGLFAPDDVAEGLVSFANSRKVRQAGKRPSWRK